MDDIFIYSPVDLSLKDCVRIKENNSCMWNLRFYDAGSFQFNLQGNVFSVGDIVRQGDKAGIVMKVLKNGFDVVVYGYTLNAVTKFRHIYPSATYIGTPEQIITNVATDVLTLGIRAIPKLSVLQNQTVKTDEYTLKFKNNNVFDKLLEFTKLTEVSYDIQFTEDDSLAFKCLQGRNMTDFLMFGRRYKTVDSIEYTQDDYNSKNVVYTQREEYDRDAEQYVMVPTIVGSASGFLRRETATDNYNEAQTIINSNKMAESLKGVANDKRIYKKDWLLGDYVTVAFEDLITEKQIVEVQEIYEKSNTTIIPIFGEEKTNPIKKLMQGG